MTPLGARVSALEVAREVAARDAQQLEQVRRGRSRPPTSLNRFHRTSL